MALNLVFNGTNTPERQNFERSAAFTALKAFLQAKCTGDNQIPPEIILFELRSQPSRASHQSPQPSALLRYLVDAANAKGQLETPHQSAVHFFADAYLNQTWLDMVDNEGKAAFTFTQPFLSRATDISVLQGMNENWEPVLELIYQDGKMENGVHSAIHDDVTASALEILEKNYFDIEAKKLARSLLNSQNASNN